MADKFLHTGGTGSSNVSDGSTNIVGNTLSAVNLDPSKAVKTNSTRQLVSTNLDIADVNNLAIDLELKSPALGFVNQVAIPPLPPAGQLKIFSKTDGSFYSINDLGVQTKLSPSANASTSWLFNTLTAGDPTATKFRFNNATPSLTTELGINVSDANSQDQTPLLSTLALGDKLYLCNVGATNCKLFNVSGAITNNTTWFSIPVSFEAESDVANYTLDESVSMSFFLSENVFDQNLNKGDDVQFNTVQYPLQVTPANADAGTLKLYANSNDGFLHSISETGVDLPIGGAIRWKNEWNANNTPYDKGDMVQDDGWLMVANTETSERPSPQSVGEPFYAYSGPDLDPQSLTRKSILFGQRYSFTDGGYLNGYRLFTIAGNSYIIYTILNPLTTPEIKEIIRFTATQNGWRSFNVSSLIPSNITVDVLAVVNEPDATPSITNANYNYQKPTNTDPPVAGVINQSSKEPNLLLINVIDNDATDRTALLAGIVSGDIITVGDARWSVQGSGVLTSDYYTFTVAPAVQWSVVGVQEFGFEVVSAVPITYHTSPDLNYWNGQPVSGIFSDTGDYATASITQTQYGLDINIQASTTSTEWDFANYSGSSASGSVSYDQSLNTTDVVSFAGLTVNGVASGNLPSSGDEFATKDYVDGVITTGLLNWGQYSDTQYTTSNRLTLSAGVRTPLPNNALSNITSYMPSGIDFYDPVTQKITPQTIGETYELRINFKGQSATQTNFITLDLDIGSGSPIIILERVQSFPRGTGVEHSFSGTSAIYTLGTFIANGGQMYITAEDNNTDIWDIQYLLIRTASGNIDIPDAPNDGSSYVRNSSAWLASEGFITPSGGGTGNMCASNNYDFSTITGNNNTIAGRDAGASLVAGGNNSLYGVSAGSLLSSGTRNTMVGRGSMETNSVSSFNTAVGYNCLNNAISQSNTAIGDSAGTSLVNGEGCVFVSGDTTLSTASNQIVIGSGASNDLADQCTIGNGSLNAIVNTVDNSCDLGTTARRFKELHNTGYRQTSIAPTMYLKDSSGAGTSSIHSIRLDDNLDANQVNITTGSTSLEIQSVNLPIYLTPGGNNADVSINTTTGALIVPRLTTTQRNNIITDKEGMLIQNTSTNTLETYDGTGWNALSTGGGGGSTTNLAVIYRNSLSPASAPGLAVGVYQNPLVSSGRTPDSVGGGVWAFPSGNSITTPFTGLHKISLSIGGNIQANSGGEVRFTNGGTAFASCCVGCTDDVLTANVGKTINWTCEVYDDLTANDIIAPTVASFQASGGTFNVYSYSFVVEYLG